MVKDWNGEWEPRQQFQTVVLGVLFVIPAFCGFVSVVYWFSFVLRLRERGLTEYSSSWPKDTTTRWRSIAMCRMRRHQGGTLPAEWRSM